MGASQNPPTDRRERTRPESLRLRSAAVSLTADDIHRSIDWYTRVLGFFVGEKYERDGHLQGVELKAGSVTALLSGDLQPGDELVTGVILPVDPNVKPGVNPLLNQRRGR